MTFPDLTKRGRGSPQAVPNLIDYAVERRRFHWDDVWRELSASPNGKLNIASIALDRQIAAGRGRQLAVRFVDRAGSRRDFSYDGLSGHGRVWVSDGTSLGG